MSRSVSSISASSSSWNGSGRDSLRMRISVTWTSTAPVARLGVLGPGGTSTNRPPHRQHELGAHRLRLGVGAAARAGVEDALGQTLAIPQVDEHEAAVVAPAVRPSHQGHRLAHVLAPQRPAAVGAPPPAQAFRHAFVSPAAAARGSRHSTVPSAPSTPIRRNPRASRS